MLAATAINAQKTCKDGGISATMLQEIVKAQPSSTAEKALANAIAQNKIDDLAKNYRNASGMTTKFNVETPSQSIHDQKSSGRCWMFSGLNVLRANFAAAHDQKQVVDFSQAYLFFYDQLEKANLMLQGSIDNASKPIDDERVQFFFKTPSTTAAPSAELPTWPRNTASCQCRLCQRPTTQTTRAAWRGSYRRSYANMDLSCAAWWRPRRKTRP